MAIAVILFSVLCVGLSSQFIVAPIEEHKVHEAYHNPLWMHATPDYVLPGRLEEVNVSCQFDIIHQEFSPELSPASGGRLLSLVISKNNTVNGDQVNVNLGGISFADRAVIVNEAIQSAVTYTSGRITQHGQGSEIVIKMDPTKIDVVGQYYCHGYFLNKFGDFQKLKTDIEVKVKRENGPFLQTSPVTVTSHPSTPLTLHCSIHNTVADLGTLASLIITKKDEVNHRDMAGISMLGPYQVNIRDGNQGHVTTEGGRLDGDRSFLKVNILKQELHGTYACKAMFISKIGHVTTKKSEATVTLETPTSVLRTAFAAVDPGQVRG